MCSLEKEKLCHTLPQPTYPANLSFLSLKHDLTSTIPAFHLLDDEDDPNTYSPKIRYPLRKTLEFLNEFRFEGSEHIDHRAEVKEGLP